MIQDGHEINIQQENPHFLKSIRNAYVQTPKTYNLVGPVAKQRTFLDQKQPGKFFAGLHSTFQIGIFESKWNDILLISSYLKLLPYKLWKIFTEHVWEINIKYDFCISIEIYVVLNMNWIQMVVKNIQEKNFNV